MIIFSATDFGFFNRRQVFDAVGLLAIHGSAKHVNARCNSTIARVIAVAALCPGFAYDGLEGVAAGGAASAAFLQLASANE